MSDTLQKKMIMALPKGRILKELAPLLQRCSIIPEDDFYDENSRKLRFSTNHDTLDLIRVRAFDVATFVAYGGAQFGIVGSDAIEEFDYSEIYAPIDLKIGLCRLSVAMPIDEAKKESPESWSHVKIATKYPNLTAKHFAKRGVQTDCIKLNGAMEIAPALGMASMIVDLVSTGSTLVANNMIEIEKILDVSSRFIVNRTSLKTRPEETGFWIENFRKNIQKP